MPKARDLLEGQKGETHVAWGDQERRGPWNLLEKANVDAGEKGGTR